MSTSNQSHARRRPNKAPKGRKRIAQGNALGNEPQKGSARGLDARAKANDESNCPPILSAANADLNCRCALPESTAPLDQPIWAVVGHAYLNYPLPHSAAMDEARELVQRGQHAIVVTAAVAQRMVENNTGFSMSMSPDLRF